MAGDPIDERDVDALEADRAWDGHAHAIEAPAVHEHEHGREEEHHRHPRQQQRGARDEAELLQTPEVREHEDEERGGGRDRAQQDAGAAAHGGDLDGLAQVAAEEQLLLVAKEIVDAVVDADADHDRDEHHREQ